MKWKIGFAVLALLVGAGAVPAHAMNWSLGANLGYAMFIPTDKDLNNDGVDDIENTNVFAWPSQADLPGIRVGFTGANTMHEFFIDSGLLLASQKDVGSSRSFTVTGNYQFNFGGMGGNGAGTNSGSLQPYVTVGAGVDIVGFKDETPVAPNPDIDLSASSVIFGGGLGIRHRMGNGHGTLRAEARFDRVAEGSDTLGGVDVILVPETNVFQVKLGFDLWDQ